MQQTVLNLVLTYKYYIIIPLTIVEGPLVTLICGFFLKLGFVSFWPAYLCLVVGDFTGDLIWYGVGHHFGMPFVKRFGKYFSVTEEGIGVVERIFHKYQDSILIISKLTMGFGFAIVTLFTAGLVRIPFRRYVLLNFIGEFIWTGILISVGYIFGNLYTTIDNQIGRVTTVAGFIIVFFLLIGFGKYIKNRMITSNS
jgi:membrane-associated protein